MKVTFGGAAGEVTGSACLVETDRSRVLIDFGLFQGNNAVVARNRRHRWLAADRLDAVVVTHGHLDHVGRLPLLPQLGYLGPIFMTPATVAVAKLILLDAAHLQESEAARISRRRLRAGREPVQPLFTRADVERVCEQFRSLPYREAKGIADGIQVRFEDAGHILGSASVALTVQDGKTARELVFSGDIGVKHAPLLHDPTTFQRADFVVLESTYGDRDHRSQSETLAEFGEILSAAIAQRHKVFIPAFAVGRTQVLLYHLFSLMRHRHIPRLPIIVDSPMASAANRLYAQHWHEFDAETQQLLADKTLDREWASVRTTETKEESMALNDLPGPCVIIAGAGMCNGGRILHHFKHNLWRPETRVIIVGYQSPGTLGSALVHGAKWVRIHGERIVVRAQIHTLGGFSAHAGQSELLEWFQPLAASRPVLALNHGDPAPRHALGEQVRRRWRLTPAYPRLGETLTL